MPIFAAARSALGALFPLLFVALPASAAPFLIASPTSIGVAPPQTVITFSVDTDTSFVMGLAVDLSASASDLLIVDILSLDPEITADPPIGNSASFSGALSERSGVFIVGALTVEGFTPGTPLVAAGSFLLSDGAGNPTGDFFFGPLDVAFVTTPEPASAALLGLGILLLTGLRPRSP